MSGEIKRTRWCRSAVCGSEPFIPDSEYTGALCELTCNVKQNEPEKRTSQIERTKFDAET